MKIRYTFNASHGLGMWYDPPIADCHAPDFLQTHMIAILLGPFGWEITWK